MKPTLWSRFIKWCGYIFDSISNFVSRNFGSNVGLKILSVILSFVIIYVISEKTGVVKEFTVPVKISMKTKNTALYSYSPSEVKVSLKGTLEDLSVIDDSLLFAEILIRDEYETGEEITQTLYSKNIQNKGNLRVVDIAPSGVNIVFDNEAKQRIPVSLPELQGTPLYGGKASVRFISDNEVTVTGSELGLKRMVECRLELKTSPIDVANRSNSFESVVEIIIPPDGGIKSIEPNKLKVFVDIELLQNNNAENLSDNEKDQEKKSDDVETTEKVISSQDTVKDPATLKEQESNAEQITIEVSKEIGQSAQKPQAK